MLKNISIELNVYLVILHLLLIVIFSSIYYGLASRNCFFIDKKKNKDITLISSVYYTITTHTSVGYGDISPTTNIARIFASIHQLLSLLLNLTTINFVMLKK